MNLCFYIIIFLYTLIFFLNYSRKAKIIQKIKRKSTKEKIFRLNTILDPFGFMFEPECNVIYSKLNAWQRDYGYMSLYDKTAFHFNMVIDCEPVYFNYGNKTWLIEFWKGQYGISTGAEVGIYYTKSKISSSEYENTLFECVQDKDMMPISFEVKYKDHCLFSLSNRHWWLAGFVLGVFCEPEELEVNITIDFPNAEMSKNFTNALIKKGYKKNNLLLYDTSVSFIYGKPFSDQYYKEYKYRRIVIQKINKFFCSFYKHVTDPFECTYDRILYFYYYLPYMFRHVVEINSLKMCKWNGRIRKKL